MRIEKVNTAEFRDEALQEISEKLEREIVIISKSISKGTNSTMPTRMLGDILFSRASNVCALSNVSLSYLAKMHKIKVTVRSMSSSDRQVCNGFEQYFEHIVPALYKDYGNDYLLAAGAMFHEVMQFIANDGQYVSLSTRYYIIMLYMPVVWNALRQYSKVISN